MQETMNDAVIVFLMGLSFVEAVFIVLQHLSFSKRLDNLKRMVVGKESKDNKTDQVVEVDGKTYHVDERNDIMNDAKDEIDLTEDTPVDLNKKYNIEFRVDDELVASLTGGKN